VVLVLRAEGHRKPNRGAIALRDACVALQADADYASRGGDRAGESISLAVHTRIHRDGAGKLWRGGRGFERRGSVDARVAGLAVVESGSGPAPQLTAVEDVFPATRRPASWPGSTLSRSG